MTPGHIVIVGGGLAGLRTAERVRRLGHAGPVTLVGAETIAPYDRPPLSKSLLTAQERLAPVALRAAEKYAELALDLRLGVTATGLDTKEHVVSMASGESLAYDRLVIATGARPRVIETFMRPTGVHLLRTWHDCQALRLELQVPRLPRVTVIGGGVLGCEVAASARKLGLEVHLVEALAQPLGRVLGDQVGAVVAGLHQDHGVHLHCPSSVASVEGSDRVERVVLADGTEIPADVLVVAVGAAPNTEWLVDSGLDVVDGVVCDATGTASVEGVFAVGDVARMPHQGVAGTVRLEHWTNAVDTAALVGANVLAEPAERKAHAEVAYFWSDQYDVKLQCLGLPSPDDELALGEGSWATRSFLGLYHRHGRVTGAVSIGKPAHLARCRNVVATGARIDDVLAAPPWVRR